MKSGKYSPIKLTIIILLGFVFFCVFGVLYRKSQYTETWYICTFPSTYETYTETLKFRFKENSLYGYYREEQFFRDTEEELEERYQYFKEIENTLEMDENFSYSIKKLKDHVKVNTYINVKNAADFFENYMDSFSIKSTDTLASIEEKLKKSNYSCKIKRK